MSDFQEETTSRGFKRVNFADEPCIWLGIDTIGNIPARMHLTQEQAREVLPYLQRFVETGQLSRFCVSRRAGHTACSLTPIASRPRWL